jgi:hypothetical protein
VTDQTLRTKGLGNRLREADLRFLVMSSAVSARPSPPKPRSVPSPLAVHSLEGGIRLQLHSMGIMFLLNTAIAVTGKLGTAIVTHRPHIMSVLSNDPHSD